MQITKRGTRISAEERETHIWYDAIDKVWILESNIPKHFNKALKQGWDPIKKVIYEDDGTTSSMTLQATGNAITIRNPNKKREMSDKQKAAIFGRKNNDLDDDFDEEDSE